MVPLWVNFLCYGKAPSSRAENGATAVFAKSGEPETKPTRIPTSLALAAEDSCRIKHAINQVGNIANRHVPFFLMFFAYLGALPFRRLLDVGRLFEAGKMTALVHWFSSAIVAGFMPFG